MGRDPTYQVTLRLHPKHRLPADTPVTQLVGNPRNVAPVALRPGQASATSDTSNARSGANCCYGLELQMGGINSHLPAALVRTLKAALTAHVLDDATTKFHRAAYLPDPGLRDAAATTTPATCRRKSAGASRAGLLIGRAISVGITGDLSAHRYAQISCPADHASRTIRCAEAGTSGGLRRQE